MRAFLGRKCHPNLQALLQLKPHRRYLPGLGNDMLLRCGQPTPLAAPRLFKKVLLDTPGSSVSHQQQLQPTPTTDNSSNDRQQQQRPTKPRTHNRRPQPGVGTQLVGDLRIPSDSKHPKGNISQEYQRPCHPKTGSILVPPSGGRPSSFNKFSNIGRNFDLANSFQVAI